MTKADPNPRLQLMGPINSKMCAGGARAAHSVQHNYPIPVPGTLNLQLHGLSPHGGELMHLYATKGVSAIWFGLYHPCPWCGRTEIAAPTSTTRRTTRPTKSVNNNSITGLLVSVLDLLMLSVGSCSAGPRLYAARATDAWDYTQNAPDNPDKINTTALRVAIHLAPEAVVSWMSVVTAATWNSIATKSLQS